MAGNGRRSPDEFDVWGVRGNPSPVPPSPSSGRRAGGAGTDAAESSQSDQLSSPAGASACLKSDAPNRGATSSATSRLLQFSSQPGSDSSARKTKERYTLVQVSLESNELGTGNYGPNPTDRSVTPLSGTSFTSVASNVRKLEWDPGADLGCQLFLAHVPPGASSESENPSGSRQENFAKRGSGRSVDDPRKVVLSRETRRFVERKRANSIADLNFRSYQRTVSNGFEGGGPDTYGACFVSKSSSQVAIHSQNNHHSSSSHHSSPGQGGGARSKQQQHKSPDRIQQQSQRLSSNVYSSGSVITVVQQPSPRNSGRELRDFGPPPLAENNQDTSDEPLAQDDDNQVYYFLPNGNGEGGRLVQRVSDGHRSSAESTSADGSFLKYMAREPAPPIPPEAPPRTVNGGFGRSEEEEEGEEVLVVACGGAGENAQPTCVLEKRKGESPKRMRGGESQERRRRHQHERGRHRHAAKWRWSNDAWESERSDNRSRRVSGTTNFEWWRSVSHQRRAAVTRILDDLARLDDLERMLLDCDTSSAGFGSGHRFFGGAESETSENRFFMPPPPPRQQRSKRQQQQQQPPQMAAGRQMVDGAMSAVEEPMVVPEPQSTSTPKDNGPRERDALNGVETASDSSRPLRSETSEDNDVFVDDRDNYRENNNSAILSDESCSTAVSSIYFAARRPQDGRKFKLETSTTKRSQSLSRNRRHSSRRQHRSPSPPPPLPPPQGPQGQHLEQNRKPEYHGDLMAQYMRQSGLKVAKNRPSSSKFPESRSRRRHHSRNGDDLVEAVRTSMQRLTVSSNANHFGHNFPSNSSSLSEKRVSARSVGVQASESAVLEEASGQRKTGSKRRQVKDVPKAVSFFVPFGLTGQKGVGRRVVDRMSTRWPGDGAPEEVLAPGVAQAGSKHQFYVPSLQEALNARRPNFVSRVRERQDVLAVRAFLREKAVSKKRKQLLVENGSDELGEHKNGGANGSDSGLEMAMPPPPISHREMKQRSRSKYRKLPEVRSVVESRAVEREREYNRVMAKLYKERLLRNVLRGRVNISHDACVV